MLHLRTHAKALIVPALVLIFLAVVTASGVAILPATVQPWASWVLVVVACVALIVWVIAPFLRWLTCTYTFTNRRIITRKGIINKSGHDLPLSRINNVAYRRSLIDRVFGCGTLELTTAADEPVVLDDIPDVERVHVMMTELLFSSTDPIAQPVLKDE